MSVSERPWKVIERGAIGIDDDRGRPVHDCGGDGDGGIRLREDAEHIVACVNAIFLAGISPEQLAANPGLVADIVNRSESDP